MRALRFIAPGGSARVARSQALALRQLHPVAPSTQTLKRVAIATRLLRSLSTATAPAPASSAATTPAVAAAKYGAKYSDITIGVVRESAPGEKRVAATPETVAQLTKKGYKVVVEKGAGAGEWLFVALPNEARAPRPGPYPTCTRGVLPLTPLPRARYPPHAEASFADELYVGAGARIVDSASAALSADVVLKVRPPTLAEVSAMKSGARFLGFIWPAAHKEVVDALAAKGVTAFGMEQVPRIS